QIGSASGSTEVPSSSSSSMREVSLIAAVLSALLAAASAAESSFCSQAPDADIEKACEMMQEWDQTARKEIRKRQLFGFGGGQITGGPQGCKNLQCFCSMIGNRPGCGNRAYRREYRMLSDGERQRFHNALNVLKNNGEYDRISIMHRQVGTSSGAHSGPGFLPWHREYMKRMEFALRAIDPSISLPYWDSVLESYLPDPRDSIMFSAPFMGDTDAGGNVVFGAFGRFRTLEGRPTINRQLGREGRMFTEANLNAVFSRTAVQDVLAYTAPQGGCPFPTNFQALEYTHSSVHLWIGGDMKPPTTSANDPIFFLHHCFVDFIWEQWRQMRQSRAQRETAYPPDVGTCANSQHFSYAAMRPWDLMNREGLANYYTDGIFSYAPRPSCSATNPNCGSPYLFCDPRGNAHCVAKIKLNGRCNGFEGLDACWGGVCQGGFCRAGNFGGARSTFGTTQAQTANTFAATTRPQTTAATRFPNTQQTTRFTNAQTTRQQTTFTTPRPTFTNTIATTSRGADANCFNDDPCCEPWARIGECRTNAAYMSRYCRRSCHYCSNPFDNQTGCIDRHTSCGVWRQQGYCTRRRQWMSENCQRSCGWCNQTKQQLCQASVRRRL
ncbi:hypothetical protein PMAYCL1PPCAC_13056, partial [Pristionchus mayeri]